MNQPPTIAYLYMTHFFDEHVEREFVKLKESMGGEKNVFLLYHRLPGQPRPKEGYPSFVVTNEDIKSLGFDMMQDRIVPGHLVFLTILFAQAHPEFAQYWTIEQDVRYMGDWQNFFQDVNESSADLLTAHVRRFREEPNWWWWRTFDYPKQVIPIEACLRSFNPIYRLSRQAVQLLEKALRDGCQGHSEVIVPTILQKNEMLVEDFGGIGDFVRPRNKRRHYSSITFKNGRLRYGGTFATAPARTGPGWRRNRLYHPVKAQLDNENRIFPVLKTRILHLQMLFRSLAWRLVLKASQTCTSDGR